MFTDGMFKINLLIVDNSLSNKSLIGGDKEKDLYNVIGLIAW